MSPMIDLNVNPAGTLVLSSGVIVVTDYPDAVELKAPPPPLPRIIGQLAEVPGKFVPAGVAFDTGIAGRTVPMFAVCDSSDDLYGWLVWLEDSPASDDFLLEPTPVLFSEAGVFGVDSGSLRIVDQAVLLQLPDGEWDDDDPLNTITIPRFEGGGYDGLYATFIGYRGDQLAAIYVSVAFENEFPPNELTQRVALTEDPLVLEEFNFVDINNRDFSDVSFVGKRFFRSAVCDSKFVGADLSDAALENVLMSDVDFTRCDLTNASLSYVDITRGIFRGAKFAAVVSGCRFDFCDFSELAALPHFEHTNFVHDSTFGPIKLEGFEFNGVLGDCDFAGAYLPKAVLNGSDLAGTDLSRAYLENAKMNNAILERVNLAGASMRGASLCGAKCSASHFQGADMTLVNAKGADFRDCDFSGANLTNAIVRGADFTGANMDGVEMRGAKLQGATMPDGTIHE